MTSAQSTQQNQTSLDQELRRLVARARPHKIVETGTQLGLGSTLTICEALAENGLSEDQFYSIEVNPNYYAQAWTNLGQRGFHPRLLRGLSIPRSMLPAQADPETHFPDQLDDLLGFVLRTQRPEFVMLDSAGALGFIEFQYAIGLLKSPCYVALNGVCESKHARSLALIEADGRFKLLEMSRDKGGWCMAHFKP